MEELKKELAEMQKFFEAMDKRLKPDLPIESQDGNAFSIISDVIKTLKKNGQDYNAELFDYKSRQCGNYKELLTLTMDFVNWV